MSRTNSRIILFVCTTVLYIYVYNLLINTRVRIKKCRKFYHGIIYIANEERRVNICSRQWFDISKRQMQWMSNLSHVQWGSCYSIVIIIFFLQIVACHFVRFLWLFCCLFFFDIRILIIPLVSSNSSFIYFGVVIFDKHICNCKDWPLHIKLVYEMFAFSPTFFRPIK